MEKADDVGGAFVKEASDRFVEAGIDPALAARIAVCMYGRPGTIKVAQYGETVFDKLKKILVPAAAAVAAFQVGNIVGKSGRPDRSSFGNLADYARDMHNRITNQKDPLYPVDGIGVNRNRRIVRDIEV